MPFGGWLTFLVLVFCLGSFTQQPWLIYFSVTMSLILLGAYYWQRYSFSKLHYQRHIRYRRGFPGEISPVQLSITNQKWLPLPWVHLTDPWPKNIPPTDESLMLPSHKLEQGNLSFHFSMHAFQTLTRNFDIQFIKRGIHTAGPTSLETSDGFGLVETNQELQNQEYLTVFPEILPLSALKLSSDHPFGTKKAIHRLFEDPQQTMGVREYHPQDGFRRIHWPATARSGELQVRVYEPVTAPVMTIAMNIATTEQPWLSDIPAMIENLVKVSASLAWYAIEEGYSVGLVSNGCLAHSDHPFSVSPGRSPDQLGILLQTLSATTSFFTGSFENMLVRKSVSLPMSSTLILVTAILQPELVETIYNLKRHSFKVLLFSLTEKPFPAIPGVTSFDLSGTL